MSHTQFWGISDYFLPFSALNSHFQATWIKRDGTSDHVSSKAHWILTVYLHLQCSLLAYPHTCPTHWLKNLLQSYAIRAHMRAWCTPERAGMRARAHWHINTWAHPHVRMYKRRVHKGRCTHWNETSVSGFTGTIVLIRQWVAGTRVRKNFKQEK